MSSKNLWVSARSPFNGFANPKKEVVLAGPASPTCPCCKQQLTIPGLDNDRHVDTSQVQVTNM